MLTKALQLSAILLLATTVCAKPSAAQVTARPLLLRLVKFTAVAANVKYDGADVESNDVCLHYDALPNLGRKYYWSDAMTDGLYAEGKSFSRIHQPYKLAFKAGWHEKDDDEETNNNVWGLFALNGKLWMGSNGLGILEFDPRTDLWTRYDWQFKASPGETTYLTSIDNRFLFFMSRRGEFVYSRKQRLCAQRANPIQSNLNSEHKNGSPVIQFPNQQTKREYYATLDKDFAALKTSHP